MNRIDEFNRLRALHQKIYEADCQRKRYRHLMQDFVDSGRVLFGNKRLVYRDVHKLLFDFDNVMEFFKNEQAHS